jgi:DNA-binding NarL/FixJ family response regulator
VSLRRTACEDHSRESLRVTLAAPPGLYRDLLHAALNCEERISAVDIVTLEGLRELADFALDLLLLESTTEIGREAVAQLPRLSFRGCVVLVRAGDVDVIRAAAKGGATGFVTPDAPYAAMLEGLLETANGGVACPGEVAAVLLGTMRSSSESLHGRDALTTREAAIMQLVSQGLGNKQIALALKISTATVKSHMQSIFGKLNARTRTEAAAKVRFGADLVSSSSTQLD